jgi:ATP-dependent helicase HrpB
MTQPLDRNQPRGTIRIYLRGERRQQDRAGVAALRREHAAARCYAGAILLSERPAEIDPDRAAELIAGARLRHLTDEDVRLARRLRFAQLPIDIDALVRQAAVGQRAVNDIDPANVLPWDMAQRLDRLAPERLTLPRGRSVRLDYHDDGSVSASIKLQALFGVTETPRIGPSHTAVTLLLLAPNGRPVQTTTDLQSFWTRTYPEVRKELRGRYPKHDWPENPEPRTPE